MCTYALSHIHTQTLHKAFTIAVCCYELYWLYPLCYLCCQQVYENIMLNICQYMFKWKQVQLKYCLFLSDIPQVLILVWVLLIFWDKDGFWFIFQTKIQSWIQPETIFMREIHCDNSLYNYFNSQSLQDKNLNIYQ